MPKAPPSAYLLFNIEFIAQLKATNPAIKVSEAFKLAGLEWKRLSQKDKYEEMAD
jgi:hypothetical protein